MTLRLRSSCDAVTEVLMDHKLDNLPFFDNVPKFDDLPKLNMYKREMFLFDFFCGRFLGVSVLL